MGSMIVGEDEEDVWALLCGGGQRREEEAQESGSQGPIQRGGPWFHGREQTMHHMSLQGLIFG